MSDSTKVKLAKVGGQFVFVLPPELVSELGWTHGDVCDASVEQGMLNVVRTASVNDRAMQIAHRVMDEYHEVFEALAKT